MQIQQTPTSEQKKYRLLLLSFTVVVSLAFILFCTGALIPSFAILNHFNDGITAWFAILFFIQLTFTLGAAYSFLLTQKFSSRFQHLIHITLLLLSLLFLPIPVQPHLAWHHFPVVINVLLSLVTIFGLPMIMLSSMFTLLPTWFSQSMHPKAADPYFLLGNASFASVLGLFIFLFLPNWLTLSGFSLIWFLLYILVLVAFTLSLIAVKTLHFQETLYKKYQSKQKLENATDKEFIQSRVRTKVYWLITAAISASLMFGATTDLTWQVGTFKPLLYMPIIIFCLCAGITFRSKTWLKNKFLAPVQFILLFLFLLTYYFPSWFFWGNKIVHMLTYACTLLILFQQLYARRPNAKNLASFVAIISFGSLLGASFNLFLAPVIFPIPFEFPLMIALGSFFRPMMFSLHKKAFNFFDIFVAVLIFLILFALSFALDLSTNEVLGFSITTIVTLLSIVVFSYPDRPYRFSFGLIALLIAAVYCLNPWHQNTLVYQRDFYGTIRVVDVGNPHRHLLIVNDQIVGEQFAGPMTTPKLTKQIPLCSTNSQAELKAIDTITRLYNHNALTYYTPLQELLTILGDSTPHLHVGILGVGTGSVSCFARPQDKFDFFDYHRGTAVFAKDPQLFNYFATCPPHAIYLKNPLTELAKNKSGLYDLLIIDAPNAATFPIHWLTLQAIQLYLYELKPNGIIAINISFKHQHLIPILSAVANILNLAGLYEEQTISADNTGDSYDSTWVLLSRTNANFGQLNQDDNWATLPPANNQLAWTDQTIRLHLGFK